MSNASSAASSSSLTGSQPARNPCPVPTVSGEGRYGENITYPNGLKPNPYQLLHLFNTEHLFFLRSQHKLFERIIESCSLEIANQVMYACNYQLGLEGPVMVPSTFPYHPHLSMPPPADPRVMSEYPDPLTFSLLDRLGRRTDGNRYPRPDINDTRSLISRLTSEPVDNETGLPTTAHSSPEPSNTLVYPDPTPNPDIKFKVESFDSLTSSRPEPPTAVDPRNLQTPEATVPPEGGAYPHGWRGGCTRGVRGRGRERRSGEPNSRKRRRPTDAQLEKSDSGPDPDDAARRPHLCHASRLSLDIHLATALTNEGLAALRIDGLIQAQTLCRMVAVMTMNETITMSPTTISEGNVEMLVKEYDQDAQLLFVGADPKKVRLLSVEEQQAMGWQPTSDPLATPMMGVMDEMPDTDDRPDTSYDYNTELYRDGES
uniref:Reverse transcriptase-rnase h-integrase n=1 Tax=Moniliophthora roreri TaxID=221103 RepID=A0A0W0GD30_MONRR